MRHEKPVILLSIAASKPQTYRQVILTAGGTPVGGYLPECMVPESFDGLLLGGGGGFGSNLVWGSKLGQHR